MKKGVKIGIVYMLMVLCINIPLIQAAQGWPFDEGDSLLYWFEATEDANLTAQGTLKIIVGDIATNSIEITVECEFTGSDASYWEDQLEVDEYEYVAFNLIPIEFSIDEAYYIFNEDSFSEFESLWEDYIDLITAILAGMSSTATVEGDIDDNGYTITFEDEPTNYLSVSTTRYDNNGILQSYHFSEDDDGDEMTVSIEKKLIPLPYKDLYIFIAGGGVILLLTVIIICAASKKKK